MGTWRRRGGLRHADAALGLNPEDAATHNFLGVVLASSDRLGEAIVHFREAARIEPSNARARENLRAPSASSHARRVVHRGVAEFKLND